MRICYNLTFAKQRSLFPGKVWFTHISHSPLRLWLHSNVRPAHLRLRPFFRFTQGIPQTQQYNDGEL